MKAAGRQAEERAATFLQQQGLKLLERNYRCRFGEIDLVMQEGDALVFVEVRLRRNPGFGGAAESITTAKREKLVKTAGHYLARFKRPPPCRFDAVLLEDERLEWIQGAFEA